MWPPVSGLWDVRAFGVFACRFLRGVEPIVCVFKCIRCLYSAGKLVEAPTDTTASLAVPNRLALSRQASAMSQLLLQCAGRLLFTSEEDASLQEGLSDLLQCTEVLCAPQLTLLANAGAHPA